MLSWTGERFIPELKGQIALEHLHRYAMARELAKGKDVLDIASGEGYGSAMLAEVAHKVIGVDISRKAVAHAKKTYVKNNLAFRVGNCAEIPLKDASVDLVVSFETIEHHDQHEAMMAEIKRVLRPNGILIISSPEKYEYSVAPAYTNPFHVKELYRSEFEELIASYFKHVIMYGQRVIYGSGIFVENKLSDIINYGEQSGKLTAASGIARPTYLIAIASNNKVSKAASGILEQSINDSDFARSTSHDLVERDAQIAGLNQAVADRDGQIAGLNKAVADHDGQIAGLNKAVADRDGQIAGLNKAVADRDGQIAGLNQSVTERDRQITSLNQSVTERDRQITSLNHAIAERNRELTGLNQAMFDRDEQIGHLNQAAVGHETQIASLNQAVAKRDGQIESINEAMAERDRQISKLNEALAERETSHRQQQAALENLQNELATLRNTRSWRLTAPLRVVAGWFSSARPQAGRVDSAAPDLMALLGYQDRQFVESAYLTLLKRPHDPEGLNYYLGRLLAGVPKIRILSQIMDSPEAAIKGVDVPSWRAAIRLYKISRLPLIGRLFTAPSNFVFKKRLDRITESEGIDSAQLLSTEKSRETALSDIQKTRILLIDRHYPEPDKDAGSVTTYSVLRLLQELRYQVTFIPDDLKDMPNESSLIESLGVECLHRPKIDSIESFLRTRGAEFGVLFLFRSHVAANYLVAARAFCPQAKVIFNMGDLHYLRESRWAKVDASLERGLAAQNTRLFEHDVISRCDISIVMSAYEHQILQTILPDSRIVLLPLYFIDTPGSENLFENRNGICFIGGYEHAPNVDAVIFFCEKIFPLVREQLPDTEFLIVGSNPPREVQALDNLPGVSVIGHLKDLKTCTQRVKLSVAPLQYGAGIKGKVITSLSMGLPCVATTIAAEGMGLKHESEILIADDPAAIAHEVVRLHTNRELWNSLSENGLKYCQRFFSYEAGRQGLAALMTEAGLPPPQPPKVSERLPNVRLETRPVRSLPEYKKWVESNATDRALHVRVEEQIRLSSLAPHGSEVRGFCQVCGHKAQFQVDLLYSLTDEDGTIRPNLRERLVHLECGLNNRMRAAIHLFEVLCAPSRDARVYLTEQITPLYAALKLRFPNLIGSEFLRDELPFGAVDSRGVRNETLEHLSFHDEQFDFIASFDVLEHVPDYQAALAECARCLKPNGKLLLSVPFVLESADNTLRARLGRDGTIEHLMTPEYHGDPLNSKGILCFHHFGWQLLEDFRQSGFPDAALYFYWSEWFGYMGGNQFILLATKACTP